jgi:adenosine deaminase CECR1
MSAKDWETSFSTSDAYLAAVTTITNREKATAFDAVAVQTASPIERAANSIVQAVRRDNHASLHGLKTDGIHQSTTDHFLGKVPLINQSRLLRIAKRMPKGGHLHCHFNTFLHPSFLIRQARNMETMFIQASRPLLSKEDFAVAEVLFRVLPVYTRGSDLFHQAYSPKNWMSYPLFCGQFPGGLDKAESWIAEKMILTEDEVHGIQQTSAKYVLPNSNSSWRNG